MRLCKRLCLAISLNFGRHRRTPYQCFKHFFSDFSSMATPETIVQWLVMNDEIECLYLLSHINGNLTSQKDTLLLSHDFPHQSEQLWDIQLPCMFPPISAINSVIIEMATTVTVIGITTD
jgi:hypothetical protein